MSLTKRLAQTVGGRPDSRLTDLRLRVHKQLIEEL